MSSIDIDNLAKEVMKGLQEYSVLVDGTVKKAVQKTANTVKKEISSNAPKRTGKYAKSWKLKQDSNIAHYTHVTVYASGQEYRLTHLLENGHAKRGEGRVEAIPHIAPAEEHGAKLLESLIEKELS